MSKSLEEMIAVNIEQAEYYDSIQNAAELSGQSGYESNVQANWLTQAWAGLRNAQQAAVREAGIEGLITEHHERWIQEKAGGSFLEVGCFSGSSLTFKLVEHSSSYLGVDLSEKAISALQSKLHAVGVDKKANAVACDFLTMAGEQRFDLIYAHGVLHHFENPKLLFSRLHRLANPGAILIFVEPVAINPIYKLIRSAYRPYQSDAAWEWPFTRGTVVELERHFTFESGFGWGRWSLPISVMLGVPALRLIARKIYLELVKREVGLGWNSSVWRNSMIAAAYRAK